MSGTIQALLRYPVKSMRGEDVAAARAVPEHGLQGDRAYAVLDVATGRVASAKHPPRWRGLLACEARFVGELAAGRRRGPVTITLPDGAVVGGEAADAALSRMFGRAVRLIDTPPAQACHDDAGAGEEGRGVPLAVGSAAGTFFDFAPIHIVTTGSLAQLQALRPGSRFDVARFRPNVVVDTGAAAGFVENAWVGEVLAIGAEVQVCVTFACPRCVMTTLAQGSLPADPEVLKAAAENMQMFALLGRRMPVVGVYATVMRGGTIRVGDEVRSIGRAPLRRVAAVMRAIKRAVRR